MKIAVITFRSLANKMVFREDDASRQWRTTR